MNKNQKTKEKTCAFYASDYHFEMISLPFIENILTKKYSTNDTLSVAIEAKELN